MSFAFNTDILPNLPKVLPNSYIISSKGCKRTPDQFHFNTAGMRELGKRYAQQMLKLEGFKFKEAERPGLLVAPATNWVWSVCPIVRKCTREPAGESLF